MILISFFSISAIIYFNLNFYLTVIVLKFSKYTVFVVTKSCMILTTYCRLCNHNKFLTKFILTRRQHIERIPFCSWQYKILNAPRAWEQLPLETNIKQRCHRIYELLNYLNSNILCIIIILKYHWSQPDDIQRFA